MIENDQSKSFTVIVTTSDEAYAESGPHTRQDVVDALTQMFPTTIASLEVYDEKGTTVSVLVKGRSK